MQSRVDRQIRALALAQQCAAHGARVRTISRITGMNPRDLLRLRQPAATLAAPSVNQSRAEPGSCASACAQTSAASG